MKERRWKETDQWRQQEVARLNSLPVRARIILRPDGSSSLSSVSPLVISRAGFDNEINFTVSSPHLSVKTFYRTLWSRRYRSNYPAVCSTVNPLVAVIAVEVSANRSASLNRRRSCGFMISCSIDESRSRSFVPLNWSSSEHRGFFRNFSATCLWRKRRCE